MMNMKFSISLLVAFTITILTINSTNAQTHDTTQNTKSIVSDSNAFISIQKELPDANLYRMTGHWIMRATSDNNCFLTRAHFSLENDKVFEHHYVGIQKVYSGELSHIKDNKILQSVSSVGEQRTIVLYQDDKIMISMLVIKDKQYLVVLVKASKTSHIDEYAIRDVISKNILNKPNLRAMTEELVKRLLFINQNHPSINYAIEDPQFRLNIAQSDLVDCDLTQAVGKWKLMGIVSGEKYKDLMEAECHLNGDKLVIDYIYSKDKSLSVTFDYVDSKIIRFDIYSQKSYDYGLIGLLYVDAKQFIAYGKTLHTGYTMGIYCRQNYNCTTDYMKGVIDNLLLFTSDVKREIKESVARIVWR